MASSQLASTSTGKRKIEIKKVELPTKRHVTFSKRKLGLFNKVTELSILCHAETALIIISQNNKLYSCGYPNVDHVLHRFMVGGSPTRMAEHESLEALRLEYEATQNQAKEEKKRLKEMKDEQESNNGGGFPCWWNNSVEEMDLDSVEQFKICLEGMKINLVAALEQKMLGAAPSNPSLVNKPIPLSTVAPKIEPQNTTSLGIQGYGDQGQVQGYWGNDGAVTQYSSLFPTSGCGHY
ncbi:hypothetical protein RJT34_17411 [Clitoria ternatea]|uniref:MADS-box domain-containing protein n=1 Tax=Clitoria ternatea TaxID=43366 RepID=A0AAN9J8Y0_CLITE